MYLVHGKSVVGLVWLAELDPYDGINCRITGLVLGPYHPNIRVRGIGDVFLFSAVTRPPIHFFGCWIESVSSLPSALIVSRSSWKVDRRWHDLALHDLGRVPISIAVHDTWTRRITYRSLLFGMNVEYRSFNIMLFVTFDKSYSIFALNNNCQLNIIQCEPRKAEHLFS